VSSSMVILNHHLCDLCGYYCRFRIGAGKAGDSIHRIPSRHYQKFNSCAERSGMDGGVDEAREFPKRRKGFSAEVVNVVPRPILKG
jgi:hypothetical protein